MPVTSASPPHQKPSAQLARGQLLTLLYIALTSASQVFLSHVGGGIPIEISLFYMALAACVVFNLWEFRRLRHNHRALRRHWRMWLMLSVAFVLNWIFSYYSVTHASADFFIGVFFLSSALCSCLREKRWLKSLFILMAILCIHALSAFPLRVLCTSMLAGAMMYLYYVSSLRFSRQSGLGPVSVVSLRCYMLLACSAAYLFAHHEFGALWVAPETLRNLLILIVANMVLPSFLSQTCLQWVGVTLFTFMNSLIPVLAFVMQSLVSGQWQTGMLIAVTLTTLMLNYDRLILLARSLIAVNPQSMDQE
ncbi:DUF3810 domain-containing protein [Serratia plymuthica]|uniref:DUF3810 domain-containing protein n=1 Tax=Serratia TaxID=613 RepID=UPI001419D6E0|nr:DUF3810 domain-containing protein [Serratia plymuthica]MBI6138845.1 hypothetical protein [Serratia plymuthica]NIC26369.1 DUF3810 domain-containing protein [Serratia plymuthica]UJE00136.1 DUF3810 domain-containing protein [Serratia plymuthica]